MLPSQWLPTCSAYLFPKTLKLYFALILEANLRGSDLVWLTGDTEFFGGWGKGYRLFCKDHQVGLSCPKWVWWHTSIITEFGR